MPFPFVETPVDSIESIRTTLVAGFKAGKNKSIAQRKENLLQLIYLIQDNKELFQEALTLDLGRHVLENNFLELNTTLTEAVHAHSSVAKWAKTEGAEFAFNFFAMRPTIRKEAKGTILIMSPFNYPLLLSLGPVASALAAGNSVLLKPSELSANTSALFAGLVPKYFDPGVFQVINGGVPQATKILELQWDHILYTGGGKVAKIVATAAAKHLTPVSLELGGKSPVVVDSKCDIKLTAKRLVWGKMANAGQTCVAPDYVLVEKPFQDTLVKEIQSVIKEFYPDGFEKSDSFCRIISPGHFERISTLIKNTKGTVVVGGETNAATKFIAPTIVKDVTPEDSLMSEELFGPVLPILPIANVDAAIKFINDRDHPLALYVFSSNSSYKNKVFDNTQSGACLANECLVHVAVDNLPFGGVGPSGYGATTGKFGFDMFTHKRCSIDSPGWLDLLLGNRYPPYNSTKDKLLSLVVPGVPRRSKPKPKFEVPAAVAPANGTATVA